MNGVASVVLLLAAVGLSGCHSVNSHSRAVFWNYTLDYESPVDEALQSDVEALDARLRAKLGMSAEQTAVGVLNLNTLRLALVRPDVEFYAASVPKIGILLAYFALHPAAATSLDATTRRELGEMIKVSSNEMAAKYSRAMGLREIQRVLDGYGLYDAQRGGGLWVGKHYGKDGERIGSPVGDNSHAATVRQLVRFYLLLEQGKLVSPAASRTMREIFTSPEIKHREDKFVKGLAERGVTVLRKSGWWENWFHDTAIVDGAGRHYLIIALTHHAKGDAYLEEFAREVDVLLASGGVRD